MNKNTKTWLIIASCLVLLGGIIFVGVMSMLKWNFLALSTTKFKTVEHAVNEGYQSIAISANTADIAFLPSENGETKVVCEEEEKVTYAVTVKENTLCVERVDTRKWYDYISFSFGTHKITVYLPEGTYGTLSIANSTGDVQIPNGLLFESMDVSTDTGHVTSFASTTGLMKIHASTGDISVENATMGSLDLSVTTGKINTLGIASIGDISLHVSTGDTHMKNTSCTSLTSSGGTGDLTLERVVATGTITVERSTGDVRLDASDAAELFLTTDTGDVTGTLLSDKVFIARTDTGRINVPKTVTGGRCEITTDTGDVQIEILK